MLIKRFFTLFALFGFAKILGGIKEVVLGWKLGVGGILDQYIWTSTLFLSPVFLIYGFATILIPAIIGNSAKENKNEAIQTIKGGAAIVAATSFIVVLLAYYLLIKIKAIEHFNEKSAVPAEAFWMAGLTPIGVWIAYITGVMAHAGKRRISVMESIPSVVMIVVIINISRLSYENLVYATLFAYSMQLLAMIYFSGLSREFVRPKFNLARMYFDNKSTIYVVLASQVVFWIPGTVDILISPIFGEGYSAAINYSYKFIGILIGACAVSINRAVLPILYKTLSVGHSVNLGLNGLMAAFFSGGAISLLAYFGMGPILEPIMVRGLFTVDDLGSVMSLAHIGLMQVPFCVAAVYLLSININSHEANKVFAIGMTISVLSKFVVVMIAINRQSPEILMVSNVALYGSLSIIWSLSLQKRRVAG